MVPLLCWKLTAADAGRIATSAAATEMQSSAALMPHLQVKHSVLYCILNGPHLWKRWYHIMLAPDTVGAIALYGSVAFAV